MLPGLDIITALVLWLISGMKCFLAIRSLASQPGSIKLPFWVMRPFHGLCHCHQALGELSRPVSIDNPSWLDLQNVSVIKLCFVFLTDSNSHLVNYQQEILISKFLEEDVITNTRDALVFKRM